MTKSKPLSAIKLWFLLCVLVGAQSLNAQCAGANNTVTVCEKDMDPSTRTYDLFAQLNGTPTTGGEWSTTDPANFAALNRSTGIVDLWRINTFGAHVFTYTNSACGESADVTIILGGYPGEDNIDGSANACSSDTLVNLHGYLGSEVDGKVQDFNGTWMEDPGNPSTGHVTLGFFNAMAAGIGVYSFTYIVPDVGSCLGRTADLVLEVHQAPSSGDPNTLTLCANEDFSIYTNFDLNSLLFGQDAGGVWEESGTSQLDDLTDHEVNVQEIYDNFGIGEYTFTYTVFPSHPVCSVTASAVNIEILPVLQGDFDSSTSYNFCVGSPYEFPFTYDTSVFSNGEYQIEYTITDSSLIPRNGFDTINIVGGSGLLTVDPSLVTPNEFVSLDIVNVIDTSTMQPTCNNVGIPSISFLVSDPMASAADICPDTEATVALTSIFNTMGTLSNDTYNIDYVVTDSDMATTSGTAENITFSDGAASFTIPATDLGDDSAYSIALTVVGSLDLGCTIETSLTILPTPDDIALDLMVDNNCDAQQVEVMVQAPILGDGSYDIFYEVVDLSTNMPVVTNTINFIGGTATYQVDIDSLDDGDYAVIVRSTQDDTTPCRTVFNFELSENFAIGEIPEVPVAPAAQSFCTDDFVDPPTLADLDVQASGEVSFFDTETDDVVLPIETVLMDGEDYFVRVTNPISNCETPQRVGITVTLLSGVSPTTTAPMPAFCALENATIANLEATASAGGTLVWYDAATAGTVLDPTTLLVDGQSYFVAEQLASNCEGARLELIPTVYPVEVPSLQATALSICQLDNPTVAELIALENANNFDVFWYTTAENGTPLADDTPLVDDATYYAESNNMVTGCTNPNRVPVTVDLSNCDPDDYNFFIPDGFSPNADGRNDTFFIPNIEIIFPNFTYEIFNRYGSSMFTGNSGNPAWDGGDAPNGIYFYIVNYNREGFEPIQGRLYLNR